MVMFPVFAIPVSSVLHAVCLWRLSHETAIESAVSSGHFL